MPALCSGSGEERRLTPGSGFWPGVDRLDGLAVLEPRLQTEQPGGGKAPLGLCAPAPPVSPMGTCDGGREGGLGHVEAMHVAHVFLLGTVHRSRDPPRHGLGEPGSGGAAHDPEQGVCPHRGPAGKAAVQEPPAVHGNHKALAAPSPQAPGTGASPEPPWPLGLPFSSTHPVGLVTGLYVLSLVRPTSCPWGPPPLLLGLAFGPTSTWHSPCVSGMDSRTT